MELDDEENPELPAWVELAGPPQESFLENRILAEWAGSCPHCGARHCLVGWIPVKFRHQLDVRLKVGDGVLATDGGAFYVVTRPRARYLKARPVLIGGTLLERRLGPEVDLIRGVVVLSARYFLHPQPPCQALQDEDDSSMTPDRDGVPMLATEAATRRAMNH